jgi:hypothetical protein
MRSVYDAIKSLFLVRPVRATSTVTGTGIDTMGYNDAMITLEVGTVSGTSPTLDGKIQESDALGSGYVDLAGATFTQVTASNNTQKIRLNGKTKRYIRFVGTIAGTSPSFDLAANALLGNAFREPVN